MGSRLKPLLRESVEQLRDRRGKTNLCRRAFVIPEPPVALHRAQRHPDEATFDRRDVEVEVREAVAKDLAHMRRIGRGTKLRAAPLARRIDRADFGQAPESALDAGIGPPFEQYRAIGTGAQEQHAVAQRSRPGRRR